MSSLAERITEAIQESGVDVPQVAKACGVSVQAVYKWMSGQSQKISGENLVELALITKFESRWIVSGKGLKRKDPKALAVEKAMESMPEYKKDVLVQTSLALVERAQGTNNEK